MGIDIGRSGNEVFRVSVRALDVQAGEWVSGFGKHWVGPLSADERLALAESRTDESLRGLRVLPFGSGQSDLAAAYLAMFVVLVADPWLALPLWWTMAAFVLVEIVVRGIHRLGVNLAVRYNPQYPVENP